MAKLTGIKILNLDLGTSIDVGIMNPVYVLEKCSLGQLDAIYDTLSTIGVDGTDVSEVRYGTRVVSIVGWVIGNSDDILSHYRRSLNQLINPKHTLRIEFNDYALEGIPMHTVAYGIEEAVFNEKMSRFLIDIYCKDGLVSGKYKSQFMAENRTKELVFPLDFVIPTDSIVFGTLAVSQLIAVTNSGDVPAKFVATFEAKGTVVNPSIINVTTQEFIKVNETLHDGDQLIVSTESLVARVSKISNGVTTNVFNSVSNGTTWFDMPLGLTPIGYTADSGAESITVNVAFNTKYLEVL